MISARTLTVMVAALCLATPAWAQTRIVFATGPDDSGSLQRQLDAFNASHEGEIQVEWKALDQSNDVHHEQLLDSFSAGRAPHVLAADVVWTAELAKQGHVADITRRFYQDLERGDFLEPSMDSATWRLRVWGVPWYADAGVLFYRKDLVGSPPSTWQELSTSARAAQQKSGLPYGYVFQGADYEGGTVNAAEYIWGAGGELVQRQLRPTGPLGSSVVEVDVVTIDSPEAAAGLDAARELIADGVSPAEVAQWREKEAVDAFLSGEAVFLRSWPYVLGNLEGAGIERAMVGVAPLPALTADHAGTSCLGGFNLMLAASASEAEQEAAWELVQFLVAPEQQRQRALEAGLLPVHPALYGDASLLKDAPVVALAAEGVALHTRGRPMSPFYSEMSAQISSAFHRVLLGELTGAQAVDALDGELRAIANRNR